MSADKNIPPMEDAKNPFAGGTGLSKAGEPLPPAALTASPPAHPPADSLRRLRRQQWLLAGGVVGCVLAIAIVSFYQIRRLVNDAAIKIHNTQAWTAESGRYSVSQSSNFLMQARIAASQAVFAADQSRKDREIITGLRVETLTGLTNSALELRRNLARLLEEQAQTNLMRFDLNYVGRLKGIEDQIEARRIEALKMLEDHFKKLAASLARYDNLLKIDPDVAERITDALKQLKQVVDITMLIKAREEADVKALQNQHEITAEKLKVLELRQAAIQQSVTTFQESLKTLEQSLAQVKKLATTPPPAMPKPAPAPMPAPAAAQPSQPPVDKNFPPAGPLRVPEKPK